VQHLDPKGRDGGGRARVRCFGGCDELAVLDLIGLSVADLYDEPIPGRARQAMREYPYLSGSEQLVGVVQAVRAEDVPALTVHEVRWRQKSNGQLVTTPYQLPAVVAAVDQGQPVWIVEGEKDADALTRAGVTATCNAGGAGKWTYRHAQWLTGAHVTVCADTDEPGRKHACEVVASLVEIAASVRMVEPAAGHKDISEHLNAGKTVHEVVEKSTIDVVEDDVPSRRLRSTLASDVASRRLRWLWTLRILLGGLTLLAGREGLGKSTIAVDLTARITRGVLAGEMYGQPRTVIYINSEDARDYTIIPRLVAAGAVLERVVFLDALTVEDHETSLVLPLDTELLAKAVIEHNAVMVVLDAATSVVDGRLDGDKDRQMRPALEAIARGVGERTGCAVLGIVHFGKRDSSDTGKLILGSIAWSQVTRSTLAVARDDDTGNLVISATKANLSPGDTPSLAARLVPTTVTTTDGSTSVGRVEWLGETDDDARDLLGAQDVDERSELDEAQKWLRAHLNDKGGNAPAGDVIKAAKTDGVAERTLQRARKKAGITSRKADKSWVWELNPEDAEPEQSNQGANGHLALSSEDAKTPTDVHVHEPWRLGVLAPSCHPDSETTETEAVCEFCAKPTPALNVHLLMSHRGELPPGRLDQITTSLS
jgi:5S rRNA maturation endonuclease (ribonuclease M5)